MTNYDDVPLWTSNDFATKLEWANERLCDLYEGILGVNGGWFVYQAIAGWLDIGLTEDEKRQTKEMLRILVDFLRAKEEGRA